MDGLWSRGNTCPWSINVPAERGRSIQYINRLRILATYAVVTGHVAIGLTRQMQPFTAD